MENLRRIGAANVDGIVDGVVVWIDADHQGGAIARVSTNIDGIMSDSQPDAVTVPQALENARALKSRLNFSADGPIFVVLEPEDGSWNPVWGTLPDEAWEDQLASKAPSPITQ